MALNMKLKKDSKKEVSLVVSDIDNTIADYFDSWGKIMDNLVGRMSALYGVNREDVLAQAKQNAGPVFSVSPSLSHLPIFSLEGKNPEEAARLRKETARFEHAAQIERANSNKLYPGVLETVSKIKAGGAKFVLYTDASYEVALSRLCDMKFPVEMLDGLVVRGRLSDEAPAAGPVKTKVSEFRKVLEEKLGDKLVVLDPKTWKPSPKVMEDIIKQHGSTPAQTVMVGDSVKADGGFYSTGVNFAWQKQGAAVKPETSEIYASLSDKKGYSIGIPAHDSHVAKLDKLNHRQYVKKTVALDNGFSSLDRYFRYGNFNRTASQELNATRLLASKRSMRA